jgi:rhamnosyl/mannosyltransferase
VRVLHIYRTYFPDTQGGLEESIRQIALATGKLGVSSEVFTTSKQPNPETVMHDGIAVHRARENIEIASCNISFSAFSEFRHLAAEADLLHYHFPWPFADLLHMVTRMDKPSLVSYQSDVVRQRFLGLLYQPLMNWFLDSVDRIVCTSPNYLESSPVLTRYADKVTIIPNGIAEDTYCMPAAEEIRSVESEYGRDFFLFVGVLRYYKGLHVLLEAARDAPYEIVIVGSGPMKERLQAQAARLSLNNVRFAGYVPNERKAAFFESCRGVVFPSHLRSEAFGLTLLEGAMYGRPLITTEVGTGTSYVNIDGKTGLVVKPGSAEEFRKAMDRLWADKEAADAMGRNARTRFETEFDGESLGRRYLSVYNEILTSHSNGPRKAA